MALITKQLLAKPVKMWEGEAAVIPVGLHGAVPSTGCPRAWLWAWVGRKAASGDGRCCQRATHGHESCNDLQQERDALALLILVIKVEG